MIRHRALRYLASLLALFLVGTALHAGESTETKKNKRLKKQKSRQIEGKAKDFRRNYRVSEADLQANVKKVTTSLQWHHSLAEALQTGRQQDKPILWIHALGELDGFL
jgi:hypothetical protein